MIQPKSISAQLERERHANGVEWLTIGNGQRRNALSPETWGNIANWARDLGNDDSVHVAVIRGAAGDFCSGADLDRWAVARDDVVDGTFVAMEQAFAAVEALPFPTIASIGGVALGAGCQLALACDIRLISDSARIGMPIVRLGILAPESFVARLIRAAGDQTACEMLLVGRSLDADLAVRRGLALCAVPMIDLPELTAQTARQIAALPKSAVRAAKAAISAGRQSTRESSQSFVDVEVFRRALAAKHSHPPFVSKPS